MAAPLAGEKGRRGDTVGTYICADLSCSLLIRIAPPQYEMQPAPDKLVAARAAGLSSCVAALAERVLHPA